MLNRIPQIALIAMVSCSYQFAVAQNGSIWPAGDAGFKNFGIEQSPSLQGNAPLLNITRTSEERDFAGTVVKDALQYNLGMQFTPVTGLDLRAEAWGLQINEMPAGAAATSSMPRLYIENSSINEFNIDNPLLGTNVETNGIDLGASYIWDTNRFGQFKLSTKATYVDQFENKGGIVDLQSSELNTIDNQIINPELQSSLMLTWQLGNHSATAITNYFDSYKDISELDIEEINDLVDNITTIDLQYGFSIKTGTRDRAIVEFGIRNIFDEKTQQLLNSSKRILDQNGRVAYGSIKYQF